MRMNFEELNGLLNIFNLSLAIDHDYAFFTDINSGEVLKTSKNYNDRNNRAVDLFDGTGFYIEGETPYCKKEYFIGNDGNGAFKKSASNKTDDTV